MIIDELNFSLKHHNTFGISVKCRRFIEFSTENELKEILMERLSDIDFPLLLLGEGSNLLLTKDYAYTVLHSNIKGIRFSSFDNDFLLVECGSGEIWDSVVEQCIAQGLSGIENLSLIPGTIGAASVQNIGAYGVEFKDYVHEVKAFCIETAEEVVFSADKLKYSYRYSRFKDDLKDKYVITKVSLKLKKEFVPNISYGNIKEKLNPLKIGEATPSKVRQAIIDIRKEKLPDTNILGNAGSFFMNPILSIKHFSKIQKKYSDIPYYIVSTDKIKIPAGWLIEKCGWKGKRIGNVGVYGRQALVLVNYGNASGEEVKILCEKIRKDVFKTFGIRILPEVNII